ncbi:MAG: serine hydrolase, partial [Flavobacteriaceae bacterium]|nr:serine hydrolase [Flavobacteriaceae bacterium]
MKNNSQIMKQNKTPYTYRHTIKTILFIACFICFTLNTQSQKLNDKIDEVIEKYVELDMFSGTVLVAKDGKILYEKAFGESNKSYKVKNNIDTKFNICSMTKMFTGVSILQLEEQGKLKLTDPVVKHLKDFPLGDKITIHHLLSHTSGVGGYLGNPKYRANKNEISDISEILPYVYEGKLAFDVPGEKFSYSNSGMIILGAVIEKITGIKYAEYVDENIFKPVGMKNTVIRSSEEIVNNRAMGYTKSISGKFNNNVFKTFTPAPDGGVLSNVKDLLKFDQALYSSLLINEKSKEKMFTASLFEAYGYAFIVSEKKGNKVVGHSGGVPGFSTDFARYLKDKYTIIVLSNYDMVARNITYYIESIIYDTKYKLPKAMLGKFMYDNKSEIDKFDKLQSIADYIKDNKYKIRSPQYLNMVAYDMLNDNMSDYSIKIFNLNIHLFPKDANAYDSLGDAYEKTKKYDLALKNYEKAVALATENSDTSLNLFTATLERFKK